MPLRLGIYRIRVVLTLNRSTELFPFQSAVVHALISEANGRGGYGTPCIPDGLMLDAPEQCRIHFREGDSFAFGFTLLATGPAEAQSRLQRLRQGLASVGESAPAGNPSLGGNFSLLAIEDLVARSELAPGKAPQSIDLRQIQAEIEPLSQCRQATLRFISPLRFRRNNACKGHRFDDRDFRPDRKRAMTGQSADLAYRLLASFSTLPREDLKRGVKQPLSFKGQVHSEFASAESQSGVEFRGKRARERFGKPLKITSLPSA